MQTSLCRQPALLYIGFGWLTFVALLSVLGYWEAQQTYGSISHRLKLRKMATLLNLALLSRQIISSRYRHVFHI